VGENKVTNRFDRTGEEGKMEEVRWFLKVRKLNNDRRMTEIKIYTVDMQITLVVPLPWINAMDQEGEVKAFSAVECG
jgi:hypothetical protein